MSETVPDGAYSVGNRLEKRGKVVSSATPGRGQLTRTVILRAGIDFIDRHGARDLTMRRLGSSLGVEAMALYHYFAGKDDLLDGIVEQVIDDLDSDPQVLAEGADGWRDYLTRLAHGVRRMALAHPQVFPLIATRPPAAPWVRPPLRSVRWLENFLASLMDFGFDAPAAAAAYRSYTSFLLGHLLLEVAGTDDADSAGSDSLDPTDYPTVVALRDDLSRDPGDADFEAGLQDLLTRLDPADAVGREPRGG